MRAIFAGSDQNIRVIHAQAPDEVKIAPAPEPLASAKPEAAKAEATKTEAAVIPSAAVTSVSTRQLPALHPRRRRRWVNSGTNRCNSGKCGSGICDTDDCRPRQLRRQLLHQ